MLNNPGEVITEVTQFESNASPVPVPPNYYPCKKCGKLLLADDALRIHMITHSEERLFRCTDCFEIFSSSFKLSYHMKKS